MLKNTITILFLYLSITYFNESVAQDCCATDFKTTLRDTAKSLDRIDEIHRYFQHVIKKTKSDPNCSVDMLAHIYRRYGWILKRKGATKLAISKFDTVILMNKEDTVLVANMDLLKAYALGGECYKKLANYNKAKEYIHNALLIQREINYNKYTEYYYRLLGEIYCEIGDYKNAIHHYDKSVELYMNIVEQNDYYTGYAWNGLGVAYSDNKNFPKAIDALQNAISIAEENKDNRKNRQLIKVYNNLGNVYEAKKDYFKAKETYDLVIELCAKDSEIPVEDCIKAQNNLGVTLCRLEQFQESQDVLLKTLQAKKEYQDGVAYHYSYSATFENLADVPLIQNQYDTALNYYQKALINLSDNFRNTDIFTNPIPEKNPFIYSKIHLISVLDLKAQAALNFYKKNKDEQYFQLAKDAYKAADEWITLFYRDITTEKSKLEWIARSRDIYANAIEVALQSDDAEEAFYFAERARAVLLLQSLSEQTARDLLDEKDREKEDSISIEIHLQETAYFDARCRVT